MKFSADSAFRIGRAHLRTGKPCQDYALAEARNGAVAGTDDGAVIAVSDGCSSGRHTDVGARFYCLSTHQAIASAHNSWAPGEIESQQRAIIRSATNTFDLEENDLLATHLYAAVDPQNVLVRLRGDGVIALIFTDGRRVYYRHSWAKNAPAYPIYSNDNYARYRAFQDNAMSAFHIYKWSIDGDNYEAQEWNWSVEQGVGGVTMRFSAPHDIATVALFTDGVEQVAGYAWHVAVDELLAFKGVAGEFAKRRMHGFIKAAEKRGTGPEDDIGYAVINIEREATDYQLNNLDIDSLYCQVYKAHPDIPSNVPAPPAEPKDSSNGE